jgi:hypothetical protein
MAIDEPDRLIVSVSQGVPVTGRRRRALSGTIGTPGAVELHVQPALDDLEAVLDIVVHVHRWTGTVGTEPAVRFQNLTIGVLAVADYLPIHVLSRAKVEAPVLRWRGLRVIGSGVHLGSFVRRFDCSSPHDGNYK